jgi:hypothetical protein
LQFSILTVHQDELALYGRSGLVWKREEALANVNNIIWLEMPGVEETIQGNALISFEARLQKQVEELIVSYIRQILTLLGHWSKHNCGTQSIN